MQFKNQRGDENDRRYYKINQYNQNLKNIQYSNRKKLKIQQIQEIMVLK